MGQALGVAIDWGLYSQLLVTPQRPEAAGGVPGLVAYVGSLDRYQIRLRPEYAGWQAGVLSAAYGRLQAADLSLDALTAQFDANRDGQVTAAELLAVLRSLRLPLSGPQLERALLWMGVGNGWRFEAGSFLSQLHVMMRHDAPAAPAAAGGEGGEKGGGEGVEKGGGAVLLSDGSSLDGVAFVSALLCQLADTDHDGQLSASELHAASEGLWRLIDADGDGYLSYAEFADALLRLLAEGGHPRQPSLALAPGAALSREHALRLAARIDVCGTGRICFLDFLPLLTSAGGALHGSNSALIQHVKRAPHASRPARFPLAARARPVRPRHALAPGAVRPLPCRSARTSSSSSSRLRRPLPSSTGTRTARSRPPTLCRQSPWSAR